MAERTALGRRDRPECDAELTCGESELRSTGPVRHRRCYGESIAEVFACFQD